MDVGEYIRQYSALCPRYYIFNATYPPETVAEYVKLGISAGEVLVNVITYVTPFSIASNVIAAMVLFKKELRNPFNAILAIMCLATAIPFAINASYGYRITALGNECNVERFTLSLALHQVTTLLSWAPLRATYTWMAVLLTFLRYRSLKSKGRFEASYTIVFSGCVFAGIIAFAANIPSFMTSEIAYVPIEDPCGKFDSVKSGVLVPVSTYSSAMHANGCLLYRLIQWVSGVFHNALPAFLLLLFTLMLVFELIKAHKGHLAISARSATKNNDTQRAAYMLTVVAILTLLSEIPQGIVCLVNSVFPIAFFIGYTQFIDPIWKTIQILTTSCNLIITLVMSKQFRNAIIKTFCSWNSQSHPSRTVITTDRSITVQSEKY